MKIKPVHRDSLYYFKKLIEAIENNQPQKTRLIIKHLAKIGWSVTQIKPTEIQ